MFSNYLTKLKKHFAFNNKELIGILWVILIGTFIFTFSNINNWFITLLAMTLTVIVHESAHRLYSIYRGVEVRFNVWYTGLGVSVFLVFATNGAITIILPGTILAVIIEKLRIGKMPYDLTYRELSLIAFAGPFANIMIALFFKFLINYPSFNLTALETVIKINAIYAVCTMIPIFRLPSSKDKMIIKHPISDGMQVFYPYYFRYTLAMLFVSVSAFFLVFSTASFANILWINLFIIIAALMIWVYLFISDKIHKFI